MHQLNHTPQKRDVVTWRNKHKLLHINDFAVAGKTGYTKVAGRTLVTYFEKDGKEVVVVTLNHSNDWKYSCFPCEQIFLRPTIM